MTLHAGCCESCGFGPGWRTGAISLYRITDPTGLQGWHKGQVAALCDDCASGAPEAVELVGE